MAQKEKEKIMLGTKYPFEYELTSDVLSANTDGLQGYVLRLKNISEDALTDLEVELDLMDPHGIADRENQYFGSLNPNEPKTMTLMAHASETGQPYLCVWGLKGNSSFRWDTEEGEVRSDREIDAKTKAESRISEIKADYLTKTKVFDRQCKKNEDDVEKWMTGGTHTKIVRSRRVRSKAHKIEEGEEERRTNSENGFSKEFCVALKEVLGKEDYAWLTQWLVKNKEKDAEASEKALEKEHANELRRMSSDEYLLSYLRNPEIEKKLTESGEISQPEDIKRLASIMIKLKLEKIWVDGTLV